MSAIAPTQYRSFLSGPQKAAYRKIAEELFALKTTVLFDAPVSPKDADAAVRAVHRDHPELFYVDFWTYRKAVLPGTGRCLGVMFDLLLSDMRFITSGVHRAENSIQDMRQRLKNTPKAKHIMANTNNVKLMKTAFFFIFSPFYRWFDLYGFYAL